MSITIIGRTWITGKNTMVITVPSRIRKYYDLKNDDTIMITIEKEKNNESLTEIKKERLQIFKEKKNENFEKN